MANMIQQSSTNPDMHGGTTISQSPVLRATASPGFQLIHGQHVVSALKSIPDESVHMVATSPPYFGLRDYGTPPVVWDGRCDCLHKWNSAGQCENDGCDAWLGHLGLEPTRKMYVGHMVQIFREVRRVLRSDGTLWLNLGDKWRKGILQGIPGRVAVALEDDGWVRKDDIIWHKTVHKPESVRNRTTRCHENIIMMTKKQSGHYFDCDGILEPYKDGTHSLNPDIATGTLVGRRRRSVWSIPTVPTNGLHIAPWPEALVDLMVTAGSSPIACAHCGAPFRRELIRFSVPTIAAPQPSRHDGGLTSLPGHDRTGMSHGAADTLRRENPTRMLGWEPNCSCGTEEIATCAVLDPFSGSATTGVVAVRRGRSYVGIDISNEYLADASARIESAAQRRRVELSEITGKSC